MILTVPGLGELTLDPKPDVHGVAVSVQLRSPFVTLNRCITVTPDDATAFGLQLQDSATMSRRMNRP